jgi:DNA-3-methyladenine glycosylase I
MEVNSVMKRCAWANSDPLLLKYHDEEWGVPLHDDVKLFEFLVLEGAQAGLSWLTILKKRHNYQNAFDSFDPEKVAGYGSRDVNRLLADAGIVRNRLKIRSAITNARRFLEVKDEFGSFDRYIWQFTESKPIQHRFRSLSAVPARTRESGQISSALRKRGFRFVGSVICYSFMQAVGMVNDHLTTCFRYKEVRLQHHSQLRKHP